MRLGKRTDGRSPKVKEFVALAGLDDLVFTGWNIFEDKMYEAASNAGVLDYRLLEQLKPFLTSVKPRRINTPLRLKPIVYRRFAMGINRSPHCGHSTCSKSMRRRCSGGIE